MKTDEDPQKLEVNDINSVTKDDKMTTLNKSDKDANKSDDKTKSEEETVDLESILGEFKIYGWYHIKCMTLIGFLVFTNGWHGTNYVFVAENVDYT